jgi:putative oxidoreductase
MGHRYWTVTGADQIDSIDSFYKYPSTMKGFLLYIIGVGKYWIDVLWSMPAP